MHESPDSRQLEAFIRTHQEAYDHFEKKTIERSQWLDAYIERARQRQDDAAARSRRSWRYADLAVTAGALIGGLCLLALWAVGLGSETAGAYSYILVGVVLGWNLQYRLRDARVDDEGGGR